MYSLNDDMWKSFQHLASRVTALEKEKVPIMALSRKTDKILADAIKDMYQHPMATANLSDMPQLRYERFTTKKEEQKVSTINLILSADGLAAFIKDSQEMSTATKYKRNADGSKIYNDDTCSYELEEIPLAERWVSLGDIKVNEDGKFVVKTDTVTLAKMEQNNATKARVAAYQAA